VKKMRFVNFAQRQFKKVLKKEEEKPVVIKQNSTLLLKKPTAPRVNLIRLHETQNFIRNPSIINQSEFPKKAEDNVWKIVMIPNKTMHYEDIKHEDKQNMSASEDQAQFENEKNLREELENAKRMFEAEVQSTCKSSPEDKLLEERGIRGITISTDSTLQFENEEKDESISAFFSNEALAPNNPFKTYKNSIGSVLSNMNMKVQQSAIGIFLEKEGHPASIQKRRIAQSIIEDHGNLNAKNASHESSNPPNETEVYLKTFVKRIIYGDEDIEDFTSQSNVLPNPPPIEGFDESYTSLCALLIFNPLPLPILCSKDSQIARRGTINSEVFGSDPLCKNERKGKGVWSSVRNLGAKLHSSSVLKHSLVLFSNYLVN